MTSPPQIRANWTRMFLEHMRGSLPPSQLEQIFSRAGKDRLAVIDRAGPLEWLDAELHVGLLEAELEVLGTRAHEAFWRTMTRESFERPLFRTLVRGALALFGVSPGKLMRVVPQGWALITRGCGQLSATYADADAVMHWNEIPAVIRRSPCFATAWVGALCAFFDLTHVRGDVKLELSNLTTGSVHYAMRWW